MKSHGALALLLIAGGGLIYSAMHQSRYTTHTRMQSERPGSGVPARMAYAGHVAWRDAPLPDPATGVAGDVPAGHASPRFVCRLPADVGPVPLLGAVDAWLRAAPDERGDDPDLARNLRHAARQGNWLAKVQLALSLDGRRAPNDATALRPVTLLQWMQQLRIDRLYEAAGEAPGVAGRYRAGREGALSSLDLQAAMHDHYPSQYKVGRELLRSGDARQAALGRQMLDCAARALPVYAHRAVRHTMVVADGRALSNDARWPAE